MTTKQEAAIRRHGEQLLAIFPNATERDPVKLCKNLRTLEVRAAAVALRLCNGPQYPKGMADRLTGAILANVNLLLGNHPETVPVFVNRDPRGYALKIDCEWMSSPARRGANEHPLPLPEDWGGYGIIAPEIDRDGR